MMGMFDNLRCKMPLPGIGVSDLEFQTKDTDAQSIDEYEIREDGTLWHQVYDVKDNSDPNAEGIARLFGCMTRVNKRWEQDEMTGEVRFYTDVGSTPTTRGKWIEFSAYFVRGQLKHIEAIGNGVQG